MMQLSIIILSYNTKDLLSTCLESIFQNIKSDEFEVLVVDNASNDGSSQMVAREFKKVKLIQNDENLGFSKGCNIGAQQARGKYLLFLNSDAVLESNVLRVQELFEKHKDVGIIGGRFYNKDGSYQRSFGHFYTLLNIFSLLFGKDLADRIRNQTREAGEVDWVSGGFLFMRRELFEKLGGFDEHIFMYLEDMELCFRVKKAGYRVYFHPEIAARHEGYGSSNRSFAIIHIYSGLAYFYKKHKSKFEYNIVKLLLALKAYIAISIGTVTRNTYLVKTYTKALKFSYGKNI